MPPEDDESSTFPRRMRAVLLSAGCLVAALAIGGGFLWYRDWSIGPLIGQTQHDFGILLRGESGSVTGKCAFMLKNRSDAPVRVLGARGSCGCTTVALDDVTIPEGGTITIPVQLKLTRDGIKEETIKLRLDGHGVKTLHVRGEARMARPFFFKDGTHQLHSGQSSEDTLYLHVYQAGAEPGLVRTLGLPEVALDVGDWTLQHEGRPEGGMPSLWYADVQVEVADDATPGTYETVCKTDRDLTASLRVDVMSPVTERTSEQEIQMERPPVDHATTQPASETLPQDAAPAD